MLGAAVDQLGDAIATARQPGKPLSTISAITRGSTAWEPVCRILARRDGGPGSANVDFDRPLVSRCRAHRQKTGLIHRPLFAEITPG